MVTPNFALPRLLSFLGGYVDTAGFLALQGLFTAHVTGNFVTLGAALALGTSGVLAKLLALPVFCIVIVVTRIFSLQLPKVGLPILPTMLILMTTLLGLAADLALRLGPFKNSDAPSALLTGMILVCAMAILNAAHKIHLAHAPPATLMTGTTTQIMIDLADLIHPTPGMDRSAVLARLKLTWFSVACFALGCGGAAVFYCYGRMWCFLAPPAISAVGVALAVGLELRPEKAPRS